MKIKPTVLLLIMMIFSCIKHKDLVVNMENISESNKTIQHDLRILKYVTSNGEKSLRAADYYLNDHLVEKLGSESRKQFVYDSQGKLKKVITCRYNNCRSPFYELMHYDKNGNLLGSSSINTNRLEDIDTTSFEQTKFYNLDNRLTKELKNKGNDVYLKPFEIWKTYSYANDKIDVEVEFKNQDTTWVSKYNYDNDNRLISINKTLGDFFLIESFEYNNNLLTRKTLDSNRYSLNDNTSFSVYHNSTVFQYNEQNELITETLYNHKGQIHLIFNYLTEKKQ
jgi:hypothetical protein